MKKPVCPFDSTELITEYHECTDYFGRCCYNMNTCPQCMSSWNIMGEPLYHKGNSLLPPFGSKCSICKCKTPIKNLKCNNCNTEWTATGQLVKVEGETPVNLERIIL